MTTTVVHSGPMTEELGVALPWESLADHLAAQGMVLSRDVPPRRFTGGFGNLNFLLEVDDRLVVLRRPPPGPLPPGANDMARENRVLSGLSRALPVVPKSLYFCAEETVFEAPFILIEYRPGLVIRDAIPESAKSRARGISEMLVETLAKLHQVDAQAVGLGDLGRPEGFLQRTIEGWFKRAHVATDGQPPVAVETLVEWLRANRVHEGGISLIHNDYKLNNIVLDPNDVCQPVAVLDWDMCTRGDPLFDLATLLSYWVEPTDPQILFELKQMPVAGEGFMTREEAAEYYAGMTGCDLSDFAFHRVLALFKLGVVFLQLHSRYRRGQAADERYAGFRKLAEGALDFTLEVAAGRVF